MSRNTESFIELVEKYPVLYDVTHQDYKNKKVKNKIWDEICRMLGEEGNGETLKKQWKNLRDAYSKHLRSYSSKGQTKHIDRYKTWPWAKLMYFLRPHLDLELDEAQYIQECEEAASSQLTFYANEEEVSQPNTSKQKPVRNRRKRTHNQTQSQSQVNKLIHFISPNKVKEDETDLLLKSYAMKLKKMDMHRQAKVKFEIAKIMMEAELEESDEIRSRSDAQQYLESNMVTTGQLASGDCTNTNETQYVVPTVPPKSGDDDPLYLLKGT